MSIVLNSFRDQFKRYLKSKEFEAYQRERKSIPYQRSKACFIDSLLGETKVKPQILIPKGPIPTISRAWIKKKRVINT